VSSGLCGDEAERFKAIQEIDEIFDQEGMAIAPSSAHAAEEDAFAAAEA
jgi:hypothetical protein